MARPGILFSQMEPGEGEETSFDDWYESDHIPVRMELDGFASATRYRALQGEPAHLAVYELTDMGALEQPGYLKLKQEPSERTVTMLDSVRGFTRYTCEQIFDSGTPDREHTHLSVVAYAVPDEDVEQLDDWYESEHVPALLEADDWLRVRRYRVLAGEGGPWTDLALHELGSAEVMESPERAAARRGPKRDALASRDWFARSGRWLYEVLSRRT
jgi:hypothetical protein